MGPQLWVGPARGNVGSHSRLRVARGTGGTYLVNKCDIIYSRPPVTHNGRGSRCVPAAWPARAPFSLARGGAVRDGVEYARPHAGTAALFISVVP